MLRIHVNVSQYSSAHAHILQYYNVLCFLFPGELYIDQLPNFQDEIIDDTRLSKYPRMYGKGIAQ